MGRVRKRCALLLCAVLLPGLMGAAPPAPAQAVTVEAEGLAPMPAGRPLADVRREALLDARRNAVTQAHVAIETQDLVEGKRLKQSLVRARASGYVERMEVREEGPLEGADPPLYRVRVRATVLPAGDPAGLAQVRRDPYRPVVALALSGGAPGLDVDGVRATLLDSFHRCGVAVQEPRGGRRWI